MARRSTSKKREAEVGFQKFVDAFEDEDITEQEEQEALAGLIIAAGYAVLGIWDALDQISRS